MRVIAALLLVASVSLAEESPAEAFFRRVEEKYTGARTLQYKLASVAKDQGDEIEITLQVAAKAGNRFWFSGELKLADTIDPIVTTCDGKRSQTSLLGMETDPEEVSPCCDGIVRAGLVRVGFLESMPLMDQKDMGKMDKEFPVKDLKLEPDEKIGDRVAEVLTFTAGIDGSDETWKQKIWVDAESLAILKREGTRSDGGTVKETYSDTKFDEEIPDEKFALAEEEGDESPDATEGGASPEEAFEKISEAAARKDFAGIYDVIDPRDRDLLLFHTRNFGAMPGIRDEEKRKEFEALKKKHNVPEMVPDASLGMMDREPLLKVLAGMFKDVTDKRGFCVETLTFMAKNLPPEMTPFLDLAGTLKDVKEVGDSATAILVESDGKKTPLVFRKVEEKWYFSLPMK
ncbi:MAG: hypothetical protein HYY18_06760 [Planctomycetes bacterium]|nr:hypothetical protein [Planctomycetota bacterium]